MDGCLYGMRSQGVCEQFSAFMADHSHEAARRVCAPATRLSAQCSRTGKRLRRWPEALNSLRGLRYPRMVTMPA
jgi:hypothetical protein